MLHSDDDVRDVQVIGKFRMNDFLSSWKKLIGRTTLLRAPASDTEKVFLMLVDKHCRRRRRRCRNSSPESPPPSAEGYQSRNLNGTMSPAISPRDTERLSAWRKPPGDSCAADPRSIREVQNQRTKTNRVALHCAEKPGLEMREGNKFKKSYFLMMCRDPFLL